MPRFRFLLALGFFAAIAMSQHPASTLHAQNSTEGRYEVLSPWAEVDPIPLRGISPRLDNLVGKKIGLFVNYKRAARPIAESIERRLRSMYPDAQISYLHSPEWNVSVVETKNKDKFEAWAKGVNAVILSVGD